MKVLSVVGARPQFVKLAPICGALSAAGVDHAIVHTGQHYDPLLSDSFFAELDIPRPDHQLAVGSSAHGRQTGQMMIALEEVLADERPDWVLVYGDTNSTLAAALVAVKMAIPVAHLEAGLRSFNRQMPEEHNRVLTDHAADLLLAPTQSAAQHLADEGLAQRTQVVGDVMTDVLYAVRDQVEGQPIPLSVPTATDLPTETGDPSQAPRAPQPGDYYVATLHRPQNVDDDQRLTAALAALAELDKPVFLLAHPRLKAAAQRLGLYADRGSLLWLDPLPYPKLVRAAMSAAAVVTDSGGLQKEAFLLRTPCVTVRTETEWVETLELGWNVLAEPGPAIAQALAGLTPPETEAAPYGDGHAAATVAAALQQFRSEAA